MNVDLAVTDRNQVVLYLEEPVPAEVRNVIYHRQDGHVTLMFEGRQPSLTLEHPVDPDLRPAFETAGKAAIGHIDQQGQLKAEYAVDIRISERSTHS